jgi:hypothetical protein
MDFVPEELRTYMDNRADNNGVEQIFIGFRRTIPANTTTPVEWYWSAPKDSDCVFLGLWVTAKGTPVAADATIVHPNHGVYLDIKNDITNRSILGMGKDGRGVPLDAFSPGYADGTKQFRLREGGFWRMGEVVRKDQVMKFQAWNVNSFDIVLAFSIPALYLRQEAT